ncbi:MAG: hypothetical protein M3000_18775 [Bacillus wiedmannii]|uniref:hypothetical protein n=1 Tax=Bacillus cereus group TaxID=86661 RepID=UPI0005AF03A9|nr:MULTISPECIES: hypothetical protein [Bacillus cereus group]MCT6917134.1 hypothetical protein [Bacillus wiedmannii]MDA2535783.1 hypothetical protein [Bacillus cereus]KIP29721.1 putative membrane protein [Bacillus thuringiensis serovar morrisoni]MCT6948679.1 hypothetical protein [Bacillus thuringiensis]MEB8858732.1 hypothetical protein [Bacillus cereus]
MFQWFQQKLGLIGVVITLLGLCFPAVFAQIGEEIKSFTVEYWLQLSIAVIIGLLVAIVWLIVRRE